VFYSVAMGLLGYSECFRVFLCGCYVILSILDCCYVVARLLIYFRVLLCVFFIVLNVLECCYAVSRLF